MLPRYSLSEPASFHPPWKPTLPPFLLVLSLSWNGLILKYCRNPAFFFTRSYSLPLCLSVASVAVRVCPFCSIRVTTPQTPSPLPQPRPALKIAVFSYISPVPLFSVTIGLLSVFLAVRPSRRWSHHPPMSLCLLLGPRILNIPFPPLLPFFFLDSKLSFGSFPERHQPLYCIFCGPHSLFKESSLLSAMDRRVFYPVAIHLRFFFFFFLLLLFFVPLPVQGPLPPPP